VTALGERAGAPLEVARGHVVEDQRVVQVTLRQPILDARLTWQKPVHGVVELILGSVLDAQHFAQARLRGFGGDRAAGGELRAGGDNACNDHRQNQIAFATGSRGDEFVEAEIAKALEDRGDVPMGQAANALEAALGRHHGLALERQADGFECGRWQMREIAEGLVFDLAGFAVGASE
jgi:hypothetical protein